MNCKSVITIVLLLTSLVNAKDGFVCTKRKPKSKLSNFWNKKSPYHGTVYYFPDTITSSDPTSYQGVKYVGQKFRKVYDYRNGGGLINIKAYLYKVKFSDSPSVEFRLNPEFSLKESKLQAKKYGQALGRIPKIFRSRLDSFAIHKGSVAEGGHAGANWVRKSITINTGFGEKRFRDGNIEELLIHEGAHVSLDNYHKDSWDWKCAQNMDNKYISTYARNKPTEDFAESVLPWVAITYRADRQKKNVIKTVQKSMPNRIKYLNSKLSIEFVTNSKLNSKL